MSDKLCKDCHFVDSPGFISKALGSWSRCTRTKVVYHDRVNGKHRDVTANCLTERGPHGECGPSGKLFKVRL